MEDIKQDVESVPSPDIEQEVVNTSQEATPEAQPQEEVVPSTQEVKPEVHDNRPIENVAWETKRKLDEIVPSLQNEIRELKTYIESNRTPQEPEYTKAQLNAYALDPTTTTAQRLWALTEVEKKERAERIKDYESLMANTRQKTEAENRRNQSANWVAQTFPETVVKDNLGNTQGWNNNSPLLAKANEYMHRSENLRNDPEGFMAAVKMAAFDLGVNMNLTNKINKTVGQLRKEQKKGLASVGGTRIADNPNATQVRVDKLKKLYSETGDSKVFEELVKMKNINPFV